MTVITLTTDFGNEGGYAAAMKGVILGINPEARIIDITHQIRPQNISEAAFVLSTVYKYFPLGTIHLAVVDPGVGTTRRPIILKTVSYSFIGPDNGLFTYIVRDYYTDEVPLKIERGKMRLPTETTAVNLTNSKYWHEPISATFHGRDIFAPVAAHLSLGVPLDDFGEAIGEIIALPEYQPVKKSHGTVQGHVIYIDHFGNVITSIRDSDLPKINKEITIEIKDHTLTGLVKTYAGGKGLVALFGSSGYLEIALSNGNAANLIKASVGNQVVIRLRRSVHLD